MRQEARVVCLAAGVVMIGKAERVRGEAGCLPAVQVVERVE